MALWFTRNSTHDEDKKLLDQLVNVMARIPVERGKLSVSLQEELRVQNAGISSQPSQVNMFILKCRNFNHTDGGCEYKNIRFQIG